MRKPFIKSFHVTIIAAAFFAANLSARSQSSFSIQIVADNDFAVFGGTSNSVNDLVYQNDVSWSDQLSQLSTINFDLQPGDTTFYILGMGGGGQENISGTINGVDMTSISVFMSSDISSYLTGYNPSAVANGTFNANLSDVQLALPNVTWGSPDFNTSDTVIQSSPNKEGFHFDNDTAHLFTFQATSVGVTPTPAPEPSTCSLLAGAIAAIVFGRRRIFSSRQ